MRDISVTRWSPLTYEIGTHIAGVASSASGRFRTAFGGTLVPLELSPDQFQRLAGDVVEICTDYLGTLDTRPSLPRTSGAETKRIFSHPWVDLGMHEEALAELTTVIENSKPLNPRSFGYVQGSGDPVGAVADLLA